MLLCPLKRKLVKSDDLPGPSGEVGTSDSEEDEKLAFAKSLFFKNKGKQGKCTSTPKSSPKNTPKNRKDGKKAARKKTKATAIADEPTVHAVVYGKSTRETRGVYGANGRSREGKQKRTTTVFNGCIKAAWKHFKGRCQSEIVKFRP